MGEGGLAVISAETFSACEKTWMARPSQMVEPGAYALHLLRVMIFCLVFTGLVVVLVGCFDCCLDCRFGFATIVY